MRPCPNHTNVLTFVFREHTDTSALVTRVPLPAVCELRRVAHIAVTGFPSMFHISYSLNFLNGGYIGDQGITLGSIIEVIHGVLGVRLYLIGPGQMMRLAHFVCKPSRWVCGVSVTGLVIVSCTPFLCRAEAVDARRDVRLLVGSLLAAMCEFNSAGSMPRWTAARPGIAARRAWWARTCEDHKRCSCDVASVAQCGAVLARKLL